METCGESWKSVPRVILHIFPQFFSTISKIQENFVFSNDFDLFVILGPSGGRSCTKFGIMLILLWKLWIVLEIFEAAFAEALGRENKKVAILEETHSIILSKSDEATSDTQEKNPNEDTQGEEVTILENNFEEENAEMSKGKF